MGFEGNVRAGIPARHLAATPAHLRAWRVAHERPRGRGAGHRGPIDRPRTRAEWIEFGALALSIMLTTGALVTMVRPDLGDRPPGVELIAEDGFPELRLMAIPTYLTVLVLSVVHARALLRTAAANLVHLAVPLLAVLSLAWTIDPDVSFRRVVAFVMPTLFALVIAARYTARGVVRLLFVSLLACFVLSAVYIVLIPSVGLMHYDAAGAWRGAFTHKNVLGPVVLHTVLFALAARLHAIISGRVLALIVVAACIMVVGSHSVTSLVAFLALAAALPMFALGRVDPRGLAAYGCMGAALLVAALPFVSDIGDVMAAFGRDSSLTGRMPLWGYVLSFSGDRIVLGAGYGAFWAPESSPGAVIRELVGWNAPHAHNALLQALGDLGLVGAAAFLATWVVAIVRAAGRAGRARSGADVFPIVALWILLVLNVTESRLLEPNSLDWLLYVAIVAALARVRPADDPAGAAREPLPDQAPEPPPAPRGGAARPRFAAR